jgi:hypothetical protein
MRGSYAVSPVVLEGRGRPALTDILGQQSYHYAALMPVEVL